MTDLTTIPDRQLSDWLFYDDVRTAELLEMDAFAYMDDDDPVETARAEERAAVKAEVERRERLGITVDDPNEPTLEERLGPYGIEWQIEQRERAEGR